METETVRDIFWFERDPWGRMLKWSGDERGYWRQSVQCATQPDGSVHVEVLEEPRKVAAFVFQAALQRAFKSVGTVIVTDAGS